MYKCDVCGITTSEYFHRCPDCGVEGTKTKLEESTVPKIQLKILMIKYLNKVKWLEEHTVDENKDRYKGIIDGLMTAINDMEDILCGVPQQGIE